MTLTNHVRAIVDALPSTASVSLPVADLRTWLDEDPAPTLAVVPCEPESWRTRFWTCPAETRIDVTELAEAMNRSPDWVYRAVSVKQAAEHGRDPLPCNKLDGSLQFTVGAVRVWLNASEQVVNPARARTTLARRAS